MNTEYLSGHYETMRAIECVQEAMTLLDASHVPGWTGGAAQAEAKTRLSIREEYGLCQLQIHDVLSLLAQGNA